MAACSWMLWMTPGGAGVSADSTIYIAGAKSLLSGQGFSLGGRPITHFPPLYPLLLAATGLVEADLVRAARLLNAVLFGTNAALVALAVYWAAGRSLFVATYAASGFLLSAPILDLHAWAWSEPLFIALGLSSIVLLSMYAMTPTVPLFMASALVLGLALATRYAGVAFLPAAGIILLLVGRGKPAGRSWGAAILWLGAACAPLGIVLMRNTVIGGSAANRGLAFHPVSGPHLEALVDVSVLEFVAPVSVPAWGRRTVFALLVALAVGGLGILLRPGVDKSRGRSLGVVLSVSCVLFSVAYVLFLLASISFLDAATPIDTRLLSPVLVFMIAGSFSAAWHVSRTVQKPLIWWCFLVAAGLSMSAKAPEAIRSAVRIHDHGLGYTSREWRDSELTAFVKQVREDVTVYSNGTDVLRFLTGRESRWIPAKSLPGTLRANSRYLEQIGFLCGDVREHGALLIYFHRITWRWYLPSEAELASSCDLPVRQRYPDGTVYG
jgi:hypothetical protein